MSDSLQQALDLSMFWEYRTVLLRGLAVNVYVFAAAAVLALSIGLAAALLRVNRFRVVRALGTLHVEIFRLLRVRLLEVGDGLGQFGALAFLANDGGTGDK